MTFDEYLLNGFSVLDTCGKPEEEQLTIIKEALKSLGSINGTNGEASLEEERQKFLKLVSEGTSIDYICTSFQTVLRAISESVGISDFNDLVTISAAIAEMKK